MLHHLFNKMSLIWRKKTSVYFNWYQIPPGWPLWRTSYFWTTSPLRMLSKWPWISRCGDYWQQAELRTDGACRIMMMMMRYDWGCEKNHPPPVDCQMNRASCLHRSWMPPWVFRRTLTGRHTSAYLQPSEQRDAAAQAGTAGYEHSANNINHELQRSSVNTTQTNGPASHKKTLRL